MLERVALAQPPMDTPIERLMTQPVHTLDAAQSVQDAVLLMSRHGLRHVPVTEHGRVVAMVSERDLFALQRLSARRLGSRLREAADLQELVAAAPDIRRLARTLLAQGLSARSLTELVSHLNDLLTERVVQLAAQQHGLDLRRACWLAFGSEGRSEQTIATDQDNGLVFASDGPTPIAAPGWPWGSRSTTRSTPAATRCARAASWPASRTAASASTNGSRASATGSSRARPRTCSRPASTSTSGRWPATRR